MPDPALARTFLSIGAEYDRYRPGFPDRAADLAVAEATGGASDRVDAALDLGAGTGKFTELLVRRASRVSAIDPSDQMLAELRRKLPSVDARIGTAEHLPFADDSVDLVVAAQAFHWFDRDRACLEIARVLHPGGVFAVVWNVSGQECAWDHACGVVAHFLDVAAEGGPRPRAGFGRGTEAEPLPHEPHDPRPSLSRPAPMERPDAPGFTPLLSERITWSEPIPREDYLRRWTTVSTMLAATEKQRTAALRRMAGILDADPDTAGRDILPLLNVTEIFLFAAT